MSFHAVGRTVKFQWTLRQDATPPVKADFDIKLELPSGVVTYTDDGITTYIAPTATEQGQATYQFVPVVKGRHVVTLSVGTNTAYIVQARREIYPVIVPSHVENGPTPKSTRGPAVLPPAAP